jgi:hypothetical protein
MTTLNLTTQISQHDTDSDDTYAIHVTGKVHVNRVLGELDKQYPSRSFYLEEQYDETTKSRTGWKIQAVKMDHMRVAVIFYPRTGNRELVKLE